MIPVVLLTGFLGSGKTTLLNHLLRSARGTRIGVIVNDFGQINVDAMAVAGQVDSMVSLSNGCLCCVADTSDIDEMLGKLAGAKLDVIVIEASGLADPQTMVRKLLASTDTRVRYGGLVTVLDAAEFTRTHAEHPELVKALRIADLLVLNKIDRAGAATELIDTIRTHNGVSPIMPVSHGRVDPELLFDRAPELPVARQLSFDDLDDHSDHAHAVYDTVTFTSAEPMHPVLLMDFLDNRPAGLYRMKGFVHFGLPGHTDRFEVQTVGNYLRFHRSPWPRGSTPRTELVLIGKDVDATAADWLEACRQTGPVDVDDMLWVTRYLDSVDAVHEPPEDGPQAEQDET
ncbi:Cobalamin biosynthesis protein CobW [Kibdelosporangium sp. 4NS15]|uniref:Cobalamin biosynthesis protein CobW n=1 Tax=Kibdelosporangium persicum TaxID=2698649 RepID=A0ABX2F8H5_9PSEU|nr:GTP-binding protein [Kibdelosporangium persicum]NRN67643.1 Cobalamin biosynthesis protein CobW [Kibdelosporangium persicum]